jgi:hypothetical protein
MAGHQKPRHWRATEADAERYRVAPGTVLARPTRAEVRAREHGRRYAAATTPEERLSATVDYFRSVVSVARKRDKDRHVPGVAGLDERIAEADAALLRVAREIEQAGRIPESSTRRTQR